MSAVFGTPLCELPKVDRPALLISDLHVPADGGEVLARLDGVLAAAQKLGTTAWKATFAVPLGDGVYGNDPMYPRGAVAYTDATMKRLMQEAGLTTDRPYIKGGWSGVHGEQAEEGQDAVILRRA